VYQSQVHKKVDELLDIWHAFNRVQLIAQLMESASSRLRTGQRRRFWALTIMLIEWAIIEAVKRCFRFVERVSSNRLTIHKLVIKVRHSCVIKNWWSNCNIFKLLCFTRQYNKVFK